MSTAFFNSKNNIHPSVGGKTVNNHAMGRRIDFAQIEKLQIAASVETRVKLRKHFYQERPKHVKREEGMVRRAFSVVYRETKQGLN
jgi:hypothetical protein